MLGGEWLTGKRRRSEVSGEDQLFPLVIVCGGVIHNHINFYLTITYNQLLLVIDYTILIFMTIAHNLLVVIDHIKNMLATK